MFLKWTIKYEKLHIIIMALPLKIIGAISRGLLIPLLIYMAYFFRKKYKESSNKFFNGYFIFFVLMAFIEIGTLLFDISSILDPSSSFAGLSNAPFPDYNEINHEELFGYANNLVRPMYLVIFIILLIALSSQIQPIEIINRDEKHIMSRLLLVCIVLILLIFIPQIRYSYYTIIVITISIVAITIGMLLNIYMNLKLAIQSVGEVRKRSLYVLIGFIIFLLGLSMSARSGLLKIFNPDIDLEWDVIVSSIITFIGVILYYRAFRENKK